MTNVLLTDQEGLLGAMRGWQCETRSNKRETGKQSRIAQRYVTQGALHGSAAGLCFCLLFLHQIERRLWSLLCFLITHTIDCYHCNESSRPEASSEQPRKSHVEQKLLIQYHLHWLSQISSALAQLGMSLLACLLVFRRNFLDADLEPLQHAFPDLLREVSHLAVLCALRKGVRIPGGALSVSHCFKVTKSNLTSSKFLETCEKLEQMPTRCGRTIHQDSRLQSFQIP